MHTGYKGRTGIFEVLVIDDMVKDLILKRTSAHELARTVMEAGKFVPLKNNAAEKVINGITTLEEAASAVLV
jgi:type IV pilus assembly protein PilB